MKSFKFKIDGHDYNTSVNEISANIAEVTVNGTTFKVEIERQEAATPIRRTIQHAAQVVSAAQQNLGVQTVKAPLPGSIVKLGVSVGDKVNVGDELLTMESMKMENSIKSEYAGTIKTIFAQAGQNVMQDDKLIEIETVATAAPAAAPTVAPAAAPTKMPSAPAAAPAAPQAAVAGMKVVSPLPGSVVRVEVKEGQAVKKGDTLLTLESMKMENAIMAEQDGVVKQIVVSAGQNVMQDDLLIVLG